MKVFFNQLFDYNFYGNRKLIETFAELEAVPERSEELFNHILNAHHIWNSRIMGKTPEHKVWDKHKREAWGDIHYENQRYSFEITTNADSFEQRIDYENTEGRLFTNTLQDILFHIINHSTQHRGQILAQLREEGLEPLALDYVFYKR